MVDLYKKLSKERKELQEQGEVPSWFTTAGWQLFKEKYQYQGQTFNPIFIIDKDRFHIFKNPFKV